MSEKRTITLKDWYEESGRSGELELEIGSDVLSVAFPDTDRPGGGRPSIWFEVQAPNLDDPDDPRPLRHLAYLDIDGDDQYEYVIDFDRGTIGPEKGA